jgi:hypothetical protein
VAKVYLDLANTVTRELARQGEPETLPELQL